MHKQLVSFFVDKCNLLNEYQYGFRETNSTYMALLNIIDQISESQDVKKYSIGIFLDLSRAFDTIDHRILLQKLQVYGIRGCALKWFCSFLADRLQYACIDDIFSTLLQIKCGVPHDPYLVFCYLLYILMILSRHRIYFSLLCLRMIPTYLPHILTLMNC